MKSNSAPSHIACRISGICKKIKVLNE